MKFVISAGPTREMIDDVRFLSNLSSGRTGYALAEAARDAGHQVTLVSGPVALSAPTGVDFMSVMSAREMRDALLQTVPSSDSLIMSAAVADYRPKERIDGKLKKGEGPLTLEMVRNPDILAELGEHLAKTSDRPVMIGFALEAADGLENARAKLERKRLDLIVLNGPGNLGSARSAFTLVGPNGAETPREMPKDEFAAFLVARAEELSSRR